MSDGSYIRGGGGVTVDGALVGLILAVGVVIALAGCTVWQVVATSSNISGADRLRHSGVPVQITVTGCTGVSSGIGMGIEYYDCEGTYTLNGVRFTGLIHASTPRLPTGQVVPGRVVPSDPTTLTRTGPGSSQTVTASVGSYTGSIVLGGLTVVGAAALVLWRRRGRRRRPVEAPVT